MGKIKSTKNNYAVPEDEMSQKEFEKMISEAENGPFHAVQAVKAEFEKWKIKYLKLQ